MRNNGPGNSSGFTVTDTLPAGLGNPATTTTGCTIDAGVLTCIEGPLPVNDTFVITYTGTAPAAAGNLDNSARVVGNEQDPTPANDTSTTSTPVVPPVVPTPTPTPSPTPAPPVARPDLAVRKTAPAQAQADRTITWRIQVRNRGTGPSTGAVLTDTLPKQIRSARVSSPKGVRCTVAKRNVRCTLGTIAPGKKLVVKITGRLSPNAKGRMTNTARVTDAQDSNVRNNSSAATTRVRPVGAGTPCRFGVASTAVSPTGAPQVRTAGRAGC